MKKNISWLNVRIIIVLICFVSVFIAIFARAFQLQVLERDRLKARADRSHMKTMSIIPKRGAIYDRKMRELAVSMEVDSVYVQPSKLEDIKKTASLLSTALSVDRNDLMSKFSSKRSFIWVKRQLDFAEAERLKRLDMSGIGFIREGKRFYPDPQIASHLIGFVGIDSNGLEGIEMQYDKYLAGSSVQLVAERDALGNTLFVDSKDKEASKGMNLVLTIDKSIQYIAEKELFKAVSSNRAKGGMAIVMAPKTGEILAIANTPHFNPDNISEYRSPYAWRNKAVTDTFEPGSTFKVFLIAAAFEDGSADSNDLFFCENGVYRVGGRIVHDVKKYGWLSLAQIIKYSSNIGAAKIGDRLGRERLYRYIKDFGFGDKTGVGLPGEVSGSIPHFRTWSKVGQSNISFGQGLSVTGIQLISAFSAIANNGYLMKPYVVKEIVNEKGEITQQFRPLVLRRVIAEETARKVTDVLKETTTRDGTGIKAAIEGFEVAGKTGTAQKPDLLSGGYMAGKYMSSFIGFVPADDPELAILVMIDEPSDEFYGGVVAAPVFQEIATQSLLYLGIFSPRPGNVVSPQYINFADTASLEEEHEDLSRMPDFKGKTVRSVLRLARQVPLDVKIIGSGKAAYQRPLPGERVTAGAKSEIWFR